MSQASREGFIVRVLRVGSAAPAGVGFVIGKRHILTCAHVVNTVLGRDQRAQEAPGPEVRVPVDFPVLDDGEGAPSRSCRVEAWVPPPLAGITGGDVAGLVLVGEDLPLGVDPARLAGAVGVREAGAAVFGYPADPPRHNGAWAHCLLRGTVSSGMIQLDADSEAAFRAQPGYSGSPVVVADGAEDVTVGMLAVTSRDGDARDAYAIPVSRLMDAWPEVLEAAPACPYRGLEPFRASDAAAGLFVGREAETDQLLRMVEGRALVVVVGPSGVGKSSLVTAGLIPALSRGQWATATFRPGETPFFSLARALYELEGSNASLEDVERRSDRLRRDELAGLAGELGVLTGKRILLYIDQFEEIFTTCPDEDRTVFLSRVLPAADADDAAFRLVCTLRADFLGQLLEQPGVGLRLQDRLLTISPMDQEALERAVTVPARACGVTYDEGLAQRIALDAAGGDGGLPLMEFALAQLWPQQRRRRLRFADYYSSSFGGVRGALNRYADGVFTELKRDWSTDQIRRLLLACVRSRGGAAQATRCVVGRDRLADDWDLVEKLAERRLLMTGEDPTSHTATVELAHEALIQSWERLAGWVDADAEFQRWLATMEERAAEGDLLSDDTRIGAAERWLAERSVDIPTEVRELVKRSTSARDHRIAELEEACRRAVEEARQAEGDRRQVEKKTRSRLRQFVIALTVLLVVAIGASIMAFSQRRAAIRQRDLAISRTVADQATAIGASDPSLAVQLSLAAYRIAPTTKTRASLLSASALLTVRKIGETGDIRSVTIGPDGRTLTVGSQEQAVRLYDISNPTAPSLWSIPTAADTVAFSPDGHTLATVGADGTTRLWNVASHQPVATLNDQTGPIYSVAFSPNRHTLATGTQQTATLWDLTDPAQPHHLGQVTTGGSNAAYSVEFSPDGHSLASASADRTVRLWDVSDPRHPTSQAVLTGHVNEVTAVAFSPDGHTLASGSADRTVRLWDVSDPHHPTSQAVLTGHVNEVTAVAFSPDGHTLASGSTDRTVRLWDVSDRRHPTLGGVLTGHTDTVTAVAFSPDGHTLASGSTDHTVRLWDTNLAEAAKNACSRIATPITLAEWQQYIPELPYNPPCTSR